MNQATGPGVSVQASAEVGLVSLASLVSALHRVLQSLLPGQGVSLPAENPSVTEL